MNEPMIKNPTLEGDTFFWQGGETGVLLVHGFTATTAEVRPLAKIVHTAGYTVSGPLLPGHKTTLEAMNRCRWGDWYAAVEQAYLWLKQRCTTVIVGGESMGSLLTLRLASLHPEISGVLSYAPALRVRNIALSLFIAPFMPILRTEGGDDGLPWQGYTARPVVALTELYRLQKEVRRRLPHIRQPVAIFQGRLDQTIDPGSAEEVLQRVGSQDKQLHWFEHSSHCVIIDKELDEVARLTLGFLNSQSRFADHTK